tara:strand:- start:139 stop:276 length:138 start_codon:yes stop_codon:yes gene_type:complete
VIKLYINPVNQILKIIGKIISKKREKRPKVAMKTKGKINAQLTKG